MERKCQICDKAFSICPACVKRGQGVFCSRKCQGKARSIIMKNRKPEDHPRWKGGKIQKQCLKCGKIIFKFRCLVTKDSFCSRSCANSYHTARRKRTGTFIRCLVCGRERYVNPYALSRKEKKPKYCSQRCGAIDRVKHQRKQNTNIENIIENWLIEKNIPYEKQKSVEGIALVDFFILPNICLFVDGDYWHSLPKRILLDKRQRAHLEECGYRVYSLRGSEILADRRPDEILQLQRR